MNIRITCDQWWKPAATVDEVRQADSARRVDGRTYVAVDISWLATLAHNLATGAFGERMFRLGEQHADDVWVVESHERRWWPGCGKDAP